MEKYSKDSLEKLSDILDLREADLHAEGATGSIDGIRRFPEARLTSDYRQNFAVDVDRILNSMAYTRYIDKTQVFYLIKNDHITHRMLHVQLVSRVARTIGRFLGLNEDLIEAIAIGHDVGHPPFGHDGEKCCIFIGEINDIWSCPQIFISEFDHGYTDNDPNKWIGGMCRER